MTPLADTRAAIVRTKDWAEGTLHPTRMRQARLRLLRVRPQKVLFVCLGNVCRSPYAAQSLKKLANNQLGVESAGFIGPGRPAPEPALSAAGDRGINHASHRSQLLTSELIASADFIFLFDRHNMKRLRAWGRSAARKAMWLGDLDPIWAGKRAIVDPWGRSEEAFGQTFDRIDRCVAQLLPDRLKP